MFRIVCDPSSGSIQLCLTEIIGSGSLMFVVCLVGLGTTVVPNPSYRTHTQTHTHTFHRFKITLPNTDQAHDKHQ